jgi:hypothetical protein
MSSALLNELKKLKAQVAALSRGKSVAIWFNLEEETAERAIARARAEGRLKGNDEPLLAGSR